MPEPHTLTLPMAALTQRQLLLYVARAIPAMKEELMSALNDAVSRLGTEVSEQLEQTRSAVTAQGDALAAVQTALDQLAASDAEKAELQARLDEALAANDAAAAAINTQADALASDDVQTAVPDATTGTEPETVPATDESVPEPEPGTEPEPTTASDVPTSDAPAPGEPTV